MRIAEQPRQTEPVPPAPAGCPTSPRRPIDLDSIGPSAKAAWNLALKTAFTVPGFTTEWMSGRLKLPSSLVGKLLWNLKEDKLIEVTGQAGALNYKFSISEQGRELARRMNEICGYLGPVPVSLTDYFDGISRQNSPRDSVTLEQVYEATEGLVLPDGQKEIAALAVSSGRSLFIFGPPGNGKSTLGRMLNQVGGGYCWIPYALAVDDQIIQLFDPQVHHPVADQDAQAGPEGDRRWIKIKRPFVVAGGEMTLDQLDLAYDESNRFYEAPPHLKANCGTFMIDDFGRQRADPRDLLNRWIIPMEHQIDFLSLKTGKKIEVPFSMMLIVATNLEVEEVADTAFLRRMGYRLHLEAPDETHFKEIIRLSASEHQFAITEPFVDYMVSRYHAEKREWNASEPRELFLRCRDVSRLLKKNRGIDKEVFEMAWQGYFSNSLPEGKTISPSVTGKPIVHPV